MDKLLLTNYLIVLKGTTEVYVHGTIESSNVDVRETLKDGLNDTLSCQAKTYDKMVECGWYPTTNIDSNTIQETLDTVNKNN